MQIQERGGVDPRLLNFTGSPAVFSHLGPLLGGSFQLGCKWLLTIDHGDRFRPLRISLWDPFQISFLWLTNWRLLTNYSHK